MQTGKLTGSRMRSTTIHKPGNRSQRRARQWTSLVRSMEPDMEGSERVSLNPDSQFRWSMRSLRHSLLSGLGFCQRVRSGVTYPMPRCRTLAEGSETAVRPLSSLTSRWSLRYFVQDLGLRIPLRCIVRPRARTRCQQGRLDDIPQAPRMPIRIVSAEARCTENLIHGRVSMMRSLRPQANSR